jgi:hypothetical protein
MCRPKKQFSELHDNPVFPKLTDHYSDKLLRMAAKKDIPPNVLARMLIIKGLDEIDRLMDDLKPPNRP